MLSTGTWIVIIIAWALVDQAILTPLEDLWKYKQHETFE